MGAGYPGGPPPPPGPTPPIAPAQPIMQAPPPTGEEEDMDDDMVTFKRFC